MRSLILAVTMTAVLGCSSQGNNAVRIDATNEESLHKSVATMRASVQHHPGVVIKLTGALLATGGLNEATLKQQTGGENIEDSLPIDAFKPLHGMTFREIENTSDAFMARHMNR